MLQITAPLRNFLKAMEGGGGKSGNNRVYNINICIIPKFNHVEGVLSTDSMLASCVSAAAADMVAVAVVYPARRSDATLRCYEPTIRARLSGL